MMLLGGGHNPAAFHLVDGRRIAHDESTRRGRAGRPAGRQRAARRRGRDRRRRPGRRLDLADRERLELGIRVRARLPGQHGPAPPASSTSRPARRASIRIEQRATVTADLAVAEVPGPPVTRGRLAVHAHFYQPSRLDPWTGRVPRGARRGAVPRLERPRRRRVLSAQRRARQPDPDLVGPGTDARVMARDGGTDDARRLRDRRGGRQRDGPGLPPHDPAARVGRRPADRDPLGPARLRAAVRAPAGRAVAARDRGRPGDAPDRRRGGRPLHDPRAVAGRREPGSTAAGRTGSSSAAVRRSSSCSTTRGCRPRSRSSPRPPSDADRFARERVAAAAERCESRPTRRRSRSSRPTASSTATTSSSATCSCSASSPPTRRPPSGAGSTSSRSPTRSGSRPAGRHPVDPDRGADVVELPSRRRRAGPRSARTRSTAGGRARSGRRSSGSPRRSTPPRSGGSPRCPARRRPRGSCATPTSTSSRARRRPRRSPPRGSAVARRLDRARALALLEAQRWRLAMFASDGWFWDDPIRPETKQILRSAARAVRIVDAELGTSLEGRLVADLALFTSPSRGLDGAAIYRTALAEIGQPRARRARPAEIAKNPLARLTRVVVDFTRSIGED